MPLVYLGWGARRFGDEPNVLSLNFGWVYALVLEGNPTLLVADQRVVCKPGDAVLVGEDCPMGWEDLPRAQSQILLWIWESPPSMEALRPARGGWLRWSLNVARIESLEQNHRECRRELAEADDFTANALQALQQQLDVGWLRSRADSSLTQQRIARYATGLNWMRHNLNASHPISELAIYLGVSEATLQRIFKRNCGQSPLVVFQALKAEEAQRLLGEGHSVKSVGLQLGYKHPNDFTRFYAKAFGHPPSDDKEGFA